MHYVLFWSHLHCSIVRALTCHRFIALIPLPSKNVVGECLVPCAHTFLSQYKLSPGKTSTAAGVFSPAFLHQHFATRKPDTSYKLQPRHLHSTFRELDIRGPLGGPSLFLLISALFSSSLSLYLPLLFSCLCIFKSPLLYRFHSHFLLSYYLTFSFYFYHSFSSPPSLLVSISL